MTLFGKPAYQEDGRLMSQNNHLMGLDASLLYKTEMGGGEEIR